MMDAKTEAMTAAERIRLAIAHANYLPSEAARRGLTEDVPALADEVRALREALADIRFLCAGWYETREQAQRALTRIEELALGVGAPERDGLA
jgi:hypothetical protein